MIYINARFLTQKLTGVQRFAIEITRELKKIYGEQLILLAPCNIVHKDLADEFGVRIIGKKTGYRWEQFELPAYLKDRGCPPLLNLCNLAPLSYPNNFITVHDITWARYPSTYSRSFVAMYRYMLPRLCAKARHLFTVSEFSRKEISSEFGIPENKITVIYNAVGPEFKPVPDEDLRKENYILAVSSLKPNKNFGFIVRNLGRITEKVPGLKLYIIGDCQSKSFAKVDVDGLKSNPAVRLLGRVSDEDLVRYYSNARSFVFPSFYEGFGLPVIEAQACGCPVVSSNAASLPEILGDSALLFDPRDDDDFVSKLLQSLGQDFSQKARENVERFSWERQAGIMAAALNRYTGASTADFFLSMIRLGLGHTDSIDLDQDAASRMLEYHSDAIISFCKHHGIRAIFYDAVEKLVQSGMTLSPKMKLTYMNGAVNSEKAYGRMERVIADLAEKFASEDIRMMVLKGYGLSLNYPVPSHRPSGDLDIWLFGRQKDADEIIRKEGIPVSYELEHHSIFDYEGIEVENHSEFFNTASINSNIRFHNVLLQISGHGNIPYEIGGKTTVYFPSPTFNAIFLLRHAGTHFAPTELVLRQVLDWGFFVKAYGRQVDWSKIIKLFKDENLDRFFASINAICYDYLGFDKDIFPPMPVDAELEARVLGEILRPEYSSPKPKNIVKLLPWKWRRWKANAWKHRLVYSDSLLSTFFTQMISHIQKPKAFKM
ncbi:MAG: nucleotidyltransferase family protein [Bacteroidales bacterium]|nr:nucleotidyltransferase family protein [Bacteroidales bacterium]